MLVGDIGVMVVGVDVVLDVDDVGIGCVVVLVDVGVGVVVVLFVGCLCELMRWWMLWFVMVGGVLMMFGLWWCLVVVSCFFCFLGSCW